MKQHPRVPIVTKASLEIGEALGVIAAEYQLTHGELIGIIANWLVTEAKWMRREERHPNDPEKPGDVE